ncbi:hypothetical protein JYU04_03735 [Dehalococcoides mccartyi]|nr:hypothetical protein [Dehalococcoides mccartyi]
MERFDGSRNDGLVDLVKLQLSAPSGADLGAIPLAGFPKGNSPGPVDRGSQFLTGGSVNKSTGAQFIDVSEASELINAGEVTFVASGYFGGFSDQGDNAELKIDFLRPNGNTLSSITVGPVGKFARNGGTALLFRSEEGDIPANTDSIRAKIIFTREDGTRNDGYADNLSLVLLATSGVNFTDPGTADTHTATVDWKWNESGGLRDAAVNGSPGLGTVLADHVYTQDGDYRVGVTVTDDDGGYHLRKFDVTVNNVAPVVSAQPSSFVDGVLSDAVVASFFDVGVADVHTAVIDWGDGSTSNGTVVEDGGSGYVTGSHNYSISDGETQTIRVTVDDGDGGTHYDTALVTILTTRVTGMSIGGSTSITEGGTATFTGSFGVVKDSNNNRVNGLTYKYRFDFGDGNRSSYNSAGVGDPLSKNHVYVDDGTYIASLTVKALHPNGDLATIRTRTKAITVSNANPVVPSISTFTKREGAEIFISKVFTDAGVDDAHTAVIDWGDGSGGPLELDPATKRVTGSHVYPDDRPTGQVDKYVATISVLDGDGGVGTKSFDVNINNSAPVVNAGSNKTIFENGIFNLKPATFSDFGVVDLHTAVIDWGDGSAVEAGSVSSVSNTVSGSHRYLDNGVYTVRVTVVDDDGGSDFDELTVTVNNSAPEVSVRGTLTITEGSTATISPAKFVDDGSLDTHTAEIDWSDGELAVRANIDVTTGSITGTHVFGDQGVYVVRVSVTDSDGAVANEYFDVIVENAAPVVEPATGLTSTEGSVFTTSSIVSFSDVGLDDLHTAVIDWGDGGSSSGVVDQSADTVAGSHTYGDSGIFDVAIVVCDADGDCSQTTTTINVANVAPSVNAGADQATFEGSLVVLDPATFSDPGTSDVHSAAVNWGDGTSSDPVSVDQFLNEVSAGHVYSDEGTYLVTVTVSDDEGAVSSDSFEVSVENVAPVLDSSSDQFVDEGDLVNLSPATFNDAGTVDTHTATIDWGDGSTLEVVSTAESPFGPPGSISGVDGEIFGDHAYADEGTYRVDLAVHDSDGGSDSNSFWVTVENVAPSVSGTFDSAIDEGDTAGGSGSFIDPGVDDVWTATVDYGDGAGPEALALSAGAFVLSHVYNQNGTFNVVVEVGDGDGGTGVWTSSLVVVNIAPEIDVDESNITVDEGATATNAGAFSDQGDDIVTVTSSIGSVTQGVGSWDWSLDTTDGPGDSQLVTITATDSDGAATNVTFDLIVQNVLPTVASTSSTVTVDEGSQAANSGTFSDLGDDVVTVTASIGTISTGVGTWNWWLDTFDGPEDSLAVTITAEDSDGGITTTSFDLVVENVAPIVSADIASVTIIEGATAFNSGTVDDAGDDIVTISSSVGSISQTAGDWIWSFDSSDGPDESQTVTITATDSDGESSTVDFNLTVVNAPPFVGATSALISVDEGQLATNSGTFSDQGTDSVTISTSVGNVTQGTGTWTWSYFTADGPAESQFVTILATDSDNEVTSTTFELVVINVVPTLGIDNALVVVDEGQTAVNSGSISDPGNESVNVTASIGDVDQTTVSWSWSFDSNDGPDNSETVVITAIDADGAATISTFALLVHNVAPSIGVVNEVVVVDEGQTALNTGAFTDPGDDIVTISTSVGTVTNAGSSWNWLFDSEDGPGDSQLVTVSATDSDGAATTTSFDLVVQNVAPEFVGEFGSQALIILDEMFIGPVDFTDPGPIDTHTALVDWGDGSDPEYVTINATLVPGVAGTVAGSHIYELNGFFQVTVTLSDDDFGEDVQTFYVSVEGSRSLIQRALDSMGTFAGESKHIGHAEKKLAKALEDRNWIDEVHADLKRGQAVFSHASSAVREYEKALKDHAKGKKNTLSPAAISTLKAALFDIQIAMTILTETRMDETSGLVALDPKKQKKVDRELEQSIKEFDDALNKIAIGNLDKGIRELAKAWNHANHAEKEALKALKRKRGDDDD